MFLQSGGSKEDRKEDRLSEAGNAAKFSCPDLCHLQQRSYQLRTGPLLSLRDR